MEITAAAHRQINRIKQRLKAVRYTILIEFIKQKPWLRLEFGEIFIPVPFPTPYNLNHIVIDYADHNFIVR